jgi:COMM domain containing 7
VDPPPLLPSSPPPLLLGLNEANAGAVASEWKGNAAKLSSVASSGAVMMNELVDMQWKFGVTAATEEVEHVGSSHLQLKLVMDKGSGSRENVVLEMSLPQFYEFLAQMERAAAYVDVISRPEGGDEGEREGVGGGGGAAS